MQFQQGILPADACAPTGQRWPTSVPILPVDHTVFEGMVAQSAAMRACIAFAAQAASHTQPVWLLGEQGTGRHVLAQCMHMASPRANAPFVRLRCRNQDGVSLQKEILGGHQIPSLLQRSMGGTLYIEDAEHLSPWEHALLADMFSEKQHGRAQNPRLPRIILSSGSDLRERMTDWYWLQQLFQITVPRPLLVPPLRQRREDVPQLAERMLAKLAAMSEEPAPRGFTPRALRWLNFQVWHGNLTELHGQLQIAMNQYKADPNNFRLIDASHLTPAARPFTARIFRLVAHPL